MTVEKRHETLESAEKLIYEYIHDKTDTAIKAVGIVRGAPVQDSQKISVLENANDWIRLAAMSNDKVFEHYKFRWKREDGEFKIYSKSDEDSEWGN